MVRKCAHLFGDSTDGGSATDKNAWTGLPVIFDEVFTGFYRLGRLSAASFLGVHPDISVHAKLLTGGLLPLAVTLASKSIFEAFLGDKKRDGLLHGHSYTAYPVGCQVAVESLDTMKNIAARAKSKLGKGLNGWGDDEGPPASGPASGSMPTIWSVWSREFVEYLSKQEGVHGAWALGTVLAIRLETETGEPGYGSDAAVEIQEALTDDSITALFEKLGDVGKEELDNDGSWTGAVHSRALGDVFYLMASLTTEVGDLEPVEDIVRMFFRGEFGRRWAVARIPSG
ncbi:hypothetical protein VTK26DRAFT_8106 [Humicola hyalothermophila]